MPVLRRARRGRSCVSKSASPRLMIGGAAPKPLHEDGMAFRCRCFAGRGFLSYRLSSCILLQIAEAAAQRIRLEIHMGV